MLILLLFLLLPLTCVMVHLGGNRHFEKSCLASVMLTIIFILLSSYSLLLQHSFESSLTFTLLDLDHYTLTVKFIADGLTLIMLLFIGLVSFMVMLYASRYLYSDTNRNRFMMQLSSVTFAVVFLVMSGNLLTAFIGWQLIGFNLYWLLNHYHYDENANRAAKKKFVINRLGDMSFLFAIILCLYFYSTTDFSVILGIDSPILNIFNMEIHARTAILGCVFIAVMTKSAQFPFHIWLPDTMQTPTPVSAIMHAGVINAGGFLLARLSSGLLLSPILLGIISCIGFLTVLIGALFTITQPDVKKKLAYSTMSQMGYMVLQSGLGCFSAALFHLIAHGFYKAWSFLNAGNQLFSAQKKNKPSGGGISKILISIGMTVVMICLLMIIQDSVGTMVFAYPLLMTFILITLLQLNMNIWMNDTQTSKKLISSFLVMIIFMFTAPVFAMHNVTPINFTLQIIGIITLVFFGGVYCFIKSKPKLLSAVYGVIANKLYIEEFYRNYLLSPMRQLGDKLYYLFSNYYFLFGIITAIIIINKFLPMFFCAFLIMLLLAANRARKLKDIIIYFTLAQYTLSAIAFELLSLMSKKIAFYQMINSTVLAFVMFYCFYKIKHGKTQKHLPKNNLPWLGAYFTASLFCLIGLPFTSTFMFEIIILREAMNSMPMLVLGLLIVMFLFTVSVLHVLQDYVFNERAIRYFSIKLSIFEHIGFLILISINVINGLFPSFAVKMIYSGVNFL